MTSEYPSLPPCALTSVVPPAPRLPTLPSDAELEAALKLFDTLAERDTARRMAKVLETVRPVRRAGR